MMSTAPNPSPREFYRTALGGSFLYSGLLASHTGRRAEDIVDTPAFDALLREWRPLSLDAARRIADLAVVHLSAASLPWPWWRELLAYERAYFLQAASTDQRLVTYFPRRGVAAATVNFTWDIPQLLERIKSSAPHPLQSAAEQRVGIADVPRRNLTLLFSRGTDGKTYVIELDKPLAAVFRFTNGMRRKEQIADAAGLPLAQTEEILHALAQIGAVENA